MSTQLTRKNVPARRDLLRRNTMAFPRELRQAIPDLHAGRVLELDFINGRAPDFSLFGPPVELKLVVKETGKLKGEFVVVMGLQIDAARALAATLAELANHAERAVAGRGPAAAPEPGMFPVLAAGTVMLACFGMLRRKRARQLVRVSRLPS